MKLDEIEASVNRIVVPASRRPVLRLARACHFCTQQPAGRGGNAGQLKCPRQSGLTPPCRLRPGFARFPDGPPRQAPARDRPEILRRNRAESRHAGSNRRSSPRRDLAPAPAPVRSGVAPIIRPSDRNCRHISTTGHAALAMTIPHCSRLHRPGRRGMPVRTLAAAPCRAM